MENIVDTTIQTETETKYIMKEIVTEVKEKNTMKY